VAPRARILTFGSAAVVVAAGALCAVLVGGLTGEVLAIALVSVGLGSALLLAFLEVGLSDDRARAQEKGRGRKRTAPRHDAPPRPPMQRRPRRPG
jgi:hypothetical protein